MKFVSFSPSFIFLAQKIKCMRKRNGPKKLRFKIKEIEFAHEDSKVQLGISLVQYWPLRDIFLF